jgi:hypothetical protein
VVLVVSAQDSPPLKRKDNPFTNGDVDLNGLHVAAGKRSLVGQVEGVTVFMRVTVQMVEADLDSGFHLRFLETLSKAALNLFPRCLLGQREVQILLEAILAEIALLEGSSSLEGKPIP